MDLDIATNFTDLGNQEILLMAAEFKISINAYLSGLLYSPVRSLAQVIAFNEAHPVEVVGLEPNSISVFRIAENR
jgi:amidase